MGQQVTFEMKEAPADSFLGSEAARCRDEKSRNDGKRYCDGQALR
jgi:hypothetical protein